MKTRYLRILVSAFLTSLLLFEMAAYIVTTPPPRENFMQLYALGANGTANGYYPNNSSYLQVGENVDWQLGVVNDMNSVQLVAIRIKLGNQSVEAPNDTMALPSPAPLLAEFERFLPDNGTWQIPFVWQIVNFTTTGQQVHILSLQIDNVTYTFQNPPTCADIRSCRFRLIFELWTWNVDTADYQIGWWNGNQHLIAWLQLWFNLAPSRK